MSRIYDYNNLLSLQPDEARLPRLAADIRLLIGLRNKSRLAMAVRLAIAHKLISSGQASETSFIAWCRENVVRENGIPYSIHRIYQLVRVGNARNPSKALDDLRRREAQQKAAWRASQEEKRGTVIAINAAKVIASIPQPPRQLSGNIAEEVNRLMTAWEGAEDQARRQFLDLIGVTIARRA